MNLSAHRIKLVNAIMSRKKEIHKCLALVKFFRETDRDKMKEKGRETGSGE